MGLCSTPLLLCRQGDLPPCAHGCEAASRRPKRAQGAHCSRERVRLAGRQRSVASSVMPCVL